MHKKRRLWSLVLFVALSGCASSTPVHTKPLPSIQYLQAEQVNQNYHYELQNS